MAIGETLRDLRRDLPLNRLHKRTGLSAGYLHRVENEGVLPGDKNLEAIADGLGVDAEPLKTERDETLAERKIAEAVELYLSDDVTEDQRAEAMRSLVDQLREMKEARGDETAEGEGEPNGEPQAEPRGSRLR